MGDRAGRPKPRLAGKTCSVVGCKNCSSDIKAWNDAVCAQHAPLAHRDCPCLAPLSMHRFPNGKKNEERRRQWLANLERKNFNPGKSAMVCSIHFPDGRPTTMNPYPTEHLGKENKRVPHKGRRTVLKSAAKFTTKPSSAPAVNQGAGVSPVGPPPAGPPPAGPPPAVSDDESTAEASITATSPVTYSVLHHVETMCSTCGCDCKKKTMKEQGVQPYETCV
ncbi:uncharacterized protein LOC120851132 [Ixodes scapularis]|uniref:uncharacterized protein LOC120851132 n=1 Tax=Ixodes scapularis TaxID=6945 RepID=UPI001A9D6F6B|nr:uncharacterized protein LOC120851132 [Ixodes scapularis]